MREDAHDAAQALLDIAGSKLELAWGYAPAVVGGKALGLSFGNVDYGRAYIHTAGEWLVAASDVLGTFDPSDPDPVIDKLGKAVDVTNGRRNKLFNAGMSLGDPLTDGTKQFIGDVQKAIAAAIALLKKWIPDPDSPGFKVGLVVVALLVALVVLR